MQTTTPILQQPRTCCRSRLAIWEGLFGATSVSAVAILSCSCQAAEIPQPFCIYLPRTAAARAALKAVTCGRSVSDASKAAADTQKLRADASAVVPDASGHLWTMRNSLLEGALYVMVCRRLGPWMSLWRRHWQRRQQRRLRQPAPSARRSGRLRCWGRSGRLRRGLSHQAAARPSMRSCLSTKVLILCLW